MKVVVELDIALRVKLVLVGCVGDCKCRSGIKCVWLFCNIVRKYFGCEME